MAEEERFLCPVRRRHRRDQRLRLRRDRDRAPHKDRIGKVYAGRNGIIGALTEDLIDTGQESAAAIAALRHTPSGAFGSCRYKLKSLDDEPARVRAPDRGLQGARHRLLLLQRRRRFGRHLPQGQPAVASRWATRCRRSTCPRPIDNDLPHHRLLPRLRLGGQVRGGVDAAKPSSTCARWRTTSTKVFVLEVMGRHAGWIAAAGGLVEDARHPGRDPVPRDRVRPGEVPRQGRRAGEAARLLHRGGLRGLPPRRTARFLAEQGTRTPSATRSSAAPRRWWPTWSRRRWATSSTGRWPTTCSARRATSPRRPTWSRPTSSGKRAVELALEGPQRRDADDRAHVATRPTATRSACAPLAKVANVEKFMPRDFITEDGFGITEKCRHYLTPLIQGEDYPRLQGRPAGLRDAEERRGAEEAARPSR